MIFPSVTWRGGDYYVIALIAVALPSTVCRSFRLDSSIQPAGTTRSVGIRDVTPCVSPVGNREGKGDGGEVGGREASASEDTSMHIGEQRRMR